MSSGERPIGAAKGKQPNIEALCQNPPSIPTHPHDLCAHPCLVVLIRIQALKALHFGHADAQQ